MKQGKVWLVGAGPGDSELLTLKGKRVLDQAEVVVYDRLIGSVETWIPETAKRIPVGKSAGHHPVPQEEINRILVEQAQSGRRVVRLKGGDPFLFGRGGEELEALNKAGIPAEVVPGVPSAIAAPAYAGIPVTHRECSSSLHIITAHRKKDDPPDLDFTTLAHLKGTLVFLMGMARLEEICVGLLSAGMDGGTPAAVVQNGTRANQKVVRSTLDHLAQAAKEAEVGSPGILLVGKVCVLAESLQWADQRPLDRAQVVVTGTNPRMRDLLLAQGAEVISLPAITTKENPEAWQNQLTRLGEYDWMVFSSPAAVRHWMALLRQSRIDIRSLSGVRLAAVGPATQAALEEYGLQVDLVPRHYHSDALAAALQEQVLPGQSVLAFSPSNQESGVWSALHRLGIPAENCPIYETVATERKAEFPPEAMVVFTSASCVRSFRAMTQGQDLTGRIAVCIGPKTAAQAELYGMAVTVSPEATLASLTETVIAVQQRRKTT